MAIGPCRPCNSGRSSSNPDSRPPAMTRRSYHDHFDRGVVAGRIQKHGEARPRRELSSGRVAGDEWDARYAQFLRRFRLVCVEQLYRYEET